MKAAALCGNFVPWLCCDFTVTRQVLPQNRASSVRKIHSQITLVQLCGIALEIKTLRPIQCPGDSSVGYLRHFGNILDGQFFHNIPFPQLHREMFTSP